MNREQTMDRYKGFVNNLTMHKTSPGDPYVVHMILGMVTEAGELADIVKKAIGYNQPFNDTHAKEEAGDLLFYLQGLCNMMGWDIDELMRENMDKLHKRYPNEKFTEKDAIERKDKNGNDD